MIETDRLILRPFKISDAPVAFQWFGDPEVMEHVPFGPDPTLDKTEKRIQNYIDHFEAFGYSKYIIIEKQSESAIGDCGIMNLERTRIVELGYRIRKESWRKGFAIESALAVLKYSFQNLPLPAIHAIVEPENFKSINIIEKKLCFRHLRNGIFFGLNMGLYRMSKENFTHCTFV